MRRRPLGAALLLGLLLLWLVGYPLAIVVVEALGGFGALDPFEQSAFVAFAGRADEWRALYNSIWISVASVVLAAGLGVPLAFLLARRRVVGERLLLALLTLPVALPPLVGVIAFLFLYGESGFVARAVMALGGLDDSPWTLTGAPAILLVHTASMYVYFLLFARAALLAADESLEEAAASLGAGSWRRLRGIVLPQLRPALAGAALLTFLASMGSFSAPYIFGGGFRVMTTQITASKLNGDLVMAMTEATVLALAALAALLVGRRLHGPERLVGGTHGVARAKPRMVAGVTATIAAWGAAVVLVLPHLTLVLLSFVPTGTWTVEAWPPVLSTENYTRLVAEVERLRPVLNSLWMALVAALAALGLGMAAAWLGRGVGRSSAVGRLLDALVTLPWAVPGTVFAVALAVTFSTDAPLVGRVVLVGTPWLLPLAYLLRALPLTGRGATAGLARLDPALEEAAASLGAGRMRTFRRIVVPLVWPALAAGLSLAFIAALGDFVTSILLYTYDNRPISIEILSNLRLQETGMAAVYGVILTIVSSAALLLWSDAGRVS